MPRRMSKLHEAEGRLQKWSAFVKEHEILSIFATIHLIEDLVQYPIDEERLKGQSMTGRYYRRAKVDQHELTWVELLQGQRRACEGLICKGGAVASDLANKRNQPIVSYAVLLHYIMGKRRSAMRLLRLIVSYKYVKMQSWPGMSEGDKADARATPMIVLAFSTKYVEPIMKAVHEKQGEAAIAKLEVTLAEAIDSSLSA